MSILVLSLYRNLEAVLNCTDVAHILLKNHDSFVATTVAQIATIKTPPSSAIILPRSKIFNVSHDGAGYINPCFEPTRKMASDEQPVEYAMFCKLFLRLFGLYYFKDDSRTRRILTDAWLFFVAFVFLVTAIQAFVQQIGRSEFQLTRDSFGVLLICMTKNLA